MTRMIMVLVLAFTPLYRVQSQILVFPHREGFDSVTPPALPPGWSSTHSRYPMEDDFSTASTSPRSLPNAVLARNATLGQALFSPVLDFGDAQPGSVSFFTRRSSSFHAPVVLELSTDGGASFGVRVGDTLLVDGPAGAYLHTRVWLPDLPGEGDSIVLRWRVVPDSSGSSGTIRFDDILVERRLNTDLSVRFEGIQPAGPGETDSIRAVVRVCNGGANGVPGFALLVAHDVNGDSLLQEEEVKAEWASNRFLPAGDSLDVTVSLGLFPPGLHRLIVRLLCEGDQETGNNSDSHQFEVGLPAGAVIVNEILYAPTGVEPEWLELLNAAGGTVNLEGWQVADGGTGSPRRLTAEMHLLGAGEYLVLTGDSAAFAGVHPDVPSAVLFVPQLPSLNNTGDDVVLYDRNLRSMDSVRYLPSWGGKDGKSLERVEPLAPSTSSENWGPSQDPEGSTPGRRNSIMRLSYDLLVDVELPVHLFPKAQGAISAILRNVGGSSTGAFELLLYHDRDGDSTGGSGEVVARATVTLPLEPGDSLVLPILWTPPDPGRHEMILAVYWERDMRPSNNAVRFAAEVSYPPGAIIINEFLYEPLAGSAEFVEMQNATESSIDLEGWSVRDGPTGGGESRRFTFTGKEEVVGPGELFLLSSDTSLVSFFPTLADGEVRVFVSGGSGPGLNNNGDSIVLADPSGRSVDSLGYDPSWHNPSVLDRRGRSLEKLAPGLASNDARSWSTSLDPAGATPGRPNSLATTLPARHSRLSFAPNPFSPDNDGVEDFVIVHYEMPVPTAAVTLTVYDARGRLIRRLLVAEVGAREGEIAWDGRNEERGVARVGMYVVVLEALDETGGSVIRARGVVVLACRLE